MKKIEQGAEAKIYLVKNRIVKDRFKKTYRHEDIDNELRKQRTRREVKILQKLSSLNFPSPKIITNDDSIIEMEYIRGEKIKDIIEKNPIKISKEIGRDIAILHKNDIIHGDLTTSNMILEKNSNKIHFIDFGLSFISTKIEDKAVDLHLLRQALESKHYKVWKRCFNIILNEYKKEYEKADDVIERINKVESRGRYKRK